MPTSTQYISNELHEKAKDSLRHFLEKATRLYGPVLKTPTLSYVVKGACAGKAISLRNELQLNPALFVQNTEFFLTDVIPHELAHLLAFKVFGYGIKPHGPEWKSVMHNLGVAAKTTHDLDVSGVKRKTPTVEYLCKCPGSVQISLRRHQKVKNLRGRFVCKRCSSTMQPVSA